MQEAEWSHCHRIHHCIPPEHVDPAGGASLLPPQARLSPWQTLNLVSTILVKTLSMQVGSAGPGPGGQQRVQRAAGGEAETDGERRHIGICLYLYLVQFIVTPYTMMSVCPISVFYYL